VDYWESSSVQQMILVAYTVGVVVAVLIGVPLGIALARIVQGVIDRMN